MKPSTGSRPAGEPQHFDHRLRVGLAERAAGERGVLGVAVNLAGGRRGRGREHAVAGRAARPSAASAPACAAAAASPDRSTSSRSSGSRRSSGRSSRARLMLPPDTARRCGHRSRTSSRGRSRAAARWPAADATRPDVVEIELLVRLGQTDRRRRHAVGEGQQRGHRLHRSGGAQQVPDRRLGRGDRYRTRALPEGELDRLGLGAVVQRCGGAVGVDVVDLRGAQPGVVERRPLAAA